MSKLRKIRTQAGRLTMGERRRRIKASGAAPGEVIILDVSDRKLSKRQRRRGLTTNAVDVDFAVETQFSVDMDVRKLVNFLRIAIGIHLRESMLKGESPDGFGLHPKPRPSTLDRNPGRPNILGVLTGETAKNWYIGTIGGGSFTARAKITPAQVGGLGTDSEGVFVAGQGRDAAMAYMASRGVRFMTVEGDVAELVKQVTEQWLQAAVPSSGDGVKTPGRINPRGGSLAGFA